MSDSDGDFDTADSGAANCVPIAGGDVRKGGFLLIKGKPCKVVDCSKAKVGKHGAAKCQFTGVDIFTGKKLESICPASFSCSEPIVTRIEYQLVDVTEDGFLSLMAKDNSYPPSLPHARTPPALASWRHPSSSLALASRIKGQTCTNGARVHPLAASP
jgi:translation elongation factor IF5A